MNEKQCVKIGGHCYREDDWEGKKSTEITINDWNERLTTKFRFCIHCGKKQKLKQAKWEDL